MFSIEALLEVVFLAVLVLSSSKLFWKIASPLFFLFVFLEGGVDLWVTDFSASFLILMVVVFISSFMVSSTLLVFSMFNLMFLCVLTVSPVLFLLVFELILLPISVMIFISGSKERFEACMFLVIYTMIFSSVFFLFLLMAFFTGKVLSFSPPPEVSLSLFTLVLFFLVFFVKFPAYFLHFWLPRAHVEATTLGSVILAACLLKLGTYGFSRFYLWFKISGDVFLIVLLILGSFLAGVSCLFQTDLKALVALSSVFHMTLLALTLVLDSEMSTQTNVLISVSHGFSSAALFYLVGGLSHSVHSRSSLLLRNLLPQGGPVLLVSLLLCFVSCGLPLFLGFFAELSGLLAGLSQSLFLSGWFAIFIFMGGFYFYILFSALFSGKTHTGILTESDQGFFPPLFFLLWSFLFTFL